MIKHKVIKDESGTVDLCETYSTEKNCVGFIQKETGIMYTENPIDVIAGYIDGEPYPKYTYEEVIEEKDKNGIPTQEWEEHEIEGEQQ